MRDVLAELKEGRVSEWCVAFDAKERARMAALCDAELRGIELCAMAKAYRESLGLSARRFAYRLEIDPSAYAKYERGKWQRAISQRVFALAQGASVSVSAPPPPPQWVVDKFKHLK